MPFRIILKVVFAVSIFILSPRVLRAEVVGVWNGFLDQTNVVECSNVSAASLQAELRLYDGQGAQKAVKPFSLAAKSTIHIILNDFNIANQYGLYRTVLTSSQDTSALICQTVFYRLNPTSALKEINYAYAIPEIEPLTGTSFGTFNSFNPENNALPVYNWLSVFNPGSSAISLRLEVYDQAGNPIAPHGARISNLAPGQRKDIALGHEQGEIVGIYRVIPDDTSEYGAFLTRFGRTVTADYNYSFSLLASKGTCDTGAVPASSMGPANNWAEIANPQNLNVTFDFDVYSRNNQLLGHFRKTLPARSQTHVFLNQYIGESNVGYFRVQCVNQNTPLLVQSLFYGRTEGSSARIAWAYSSQAKQGVVLTNKYFAYNTYLGAANWLKLFNTVSDLAKTSIFTPEGSAITHNYSSISFSGTLDVPVHEQSGFNFFGLTKVEQALDTSSAELIRVYPTKAGTVGYIMNVPSLVPSVKSIVAPTSSTSSSHQASYDFYHNVYLPAVNVAPGWTGNHNSCNPGSLSPTFLSAALARVNYFRAMAGLNSDIVWDSNYNQKAQAAALVISVNNNLTHSPPSSSVCYSADALTGAQKSDITKTYLGAEAINIFIEDPGFGNYAVGHRRWILYPGQQKMGIGSVPSGGSGKPAATALYVVGSFVNRKQDVAWPPPGYVPYPVVYQRWSYSKASADFNNATIHVTVNGVRTQYQRASLISGYGDNTIVWSPSMVFPPPNLVTYHVEIGNFFIPSQPGVAQSVEYDVHVFNPNVAP